MNDLDLKIKISDLGCAAIDKLAAEWNRGDAWQITEDEIQDDIGETFNDLIQELAMSKLDGYPKWGDSFVADFKDRLFISANRVAASLGNKIQARIDKGDLDA